MSAPLSRRFSSLPDSRSDPPELNKKSKSFQGQFRKAAENVLEEIIQKVESSKRRKTEEGAFVASAELSQGSSLRLSAEIRIDPLNSLEEVPEDMKLYLPTILPYPQLTKLLQLNKRTRKAWLSTLDYAKTKHLSCFTNKKFEFESLTGHQHPIVKLISGENWFVSADSNGDIFLWDLQFKNPFKAKLHVDGVICNLLIKEDFFAAGMGNGDILVWNLRKLSEDPRLQPRVLKKHTLPVTHLLWQGVRLISAGSDGYICSWDLANEEDPSRARVSLINSLCIIGDYIVITDSKKMTFFYLQERFWTILNVDALIHTELKYHIDDLKSYAGKLFVRLAHPLADDRIVVLKIENILNYLNRTNETLIKEDEFRIDGGPNYVSREMIMTPNRLITYTLGNHIGIYNLNQKGWLSSPIVDIKEGVESTLDISNGILMTDNQLVDLSNQHVPIPLPEKTEGACLKLFFEGKLVLAQNNVIKIIDLKR